jgi:NAD(P)-dependent dehydrogenase (short-subunit alcohol dehydrogenase family)
MSPRVILVTGANKGIGLEAVKLLSAEHPQDVIFMGSRDVKNGEDAIHANKLTNVKVIQLDVTDQSTIDAAVKNVEQQYGYLNALMNNSGICTYNPSRKVAEGIMDVNVYGSQRMSDSFLPLLLASNKQSNNQSKPLIVNVTSEVGAWFNHTSNDDSYKQFMLSPEQWNIDTPTMLIYDYLASIDAANGNTTIKPKYSWAAKAEYPLFNLYKSYGLSKSIATGYSRWYALTHPEIRLAVVCPGYCATALNGFKGHRSATQGGRSVIWPITHSFETGHFHQDGKEHAWSTEPTLAKDVTPESLAHEASKE